jgi:hypothetical protein
VQEDRKYVLVANRHTKDRLPKPVIKWTLTEGGWGNRRLRPNAIVITRISFKEI